MKDNPFSHDSIRASERAATAGAIEFLTMSVAFIALTVISVNTNLSAFPWALMLVGCLCALGYGLAAGARGETGFAWRRFVSVGGTILAGFGCFALLFALFFNQ